MGPRHKLCCKGHSCSTSNNAYAPRQERYASPQELWQRVEADKEAAWYAPAVAHWDKQPATYDGVLAGLGHLNGADIVDSRAFLSKAFAAQLAAAAAGERRLVGLGATEETEPRCLPPLCSCSGEL